MKKSVCFLILFFNVLSLASGDALAFYQKNDFETALMLYARKECKSSPDWYMMGNAAFYKGRYCEAIVFWHQAAIEGPLSYKKNACENINQARTKLHYDELQELPLLYPFGINELMGVLGWALFISFFVWLLILLFIFYYRFRFPFIRFFLFICFIIVTLFVIQKLRSSHHGYSGIVVSKSSVFVRVGPSYEYHTIEQIMPGDLVIVIAQKSDWCKIYYRNAFGWIASDSLITAHCAAQSLALSSPLE